MSLGVAVVGLGVGRQHAEAFGALEGCAVRAVVDLDQGLAEETAARYPAVRPTRPSTRRSDGPTSTWCPLRHSMMSISSR